MSKKANNLVYWTPRLLSALVVVYAAKDVPDYVRPAMGFWASALAVLTHLIPSLLIAAVLWLSWRREWIAGMLFACLGAGRAYKDIAASKSDHLWLASVGLLIGILYFLNWKRRRESRVKPHSQGEASVQDPSPNNKGLP